MNPSVRNALLLAITLAATGNAMFVTGLYVLYPSYLDTGEPSVALLSWRLLEGLPPYVPFDSDTPIGNIYGPYLFLVHALIFAIGTPAVLTGKVAPALAAAAFLVCAWRAARRDGLWAVSFTLLFLTGILVINLPMTVWNRPDIFLMAMSAGAVWMVAAAEDAQAGTTRTWVLAVALGVLGGVCTGMKVHAGIYLAPVALAFAVRSGPAALFVMGGVGIAVAMLPFAFSVFSLADYVRWFERVANKPDSVVGTVKVARYAAFYILPWALALLWMRVLGLKPDRAETWYAVSFLVALGIVFFAAQKPGAGAYYLLPFAPPAADLTVRFVRRIRAAGNGHWRWLPITAAVLAIVVAIPAERRYLRNLHWQEARGIGAELRDVMADYKDARGIEMGTGDNADSYRTTFLKTLLVFGGEPYTLDTTVVMELTYLGFPPPASLIEAIRRCRTEVWLVPSGERPFLWRGNYTTDAFGDDFREGFLGAYEKVEERRYFDVWRCRGQG